MKRIIFIFAILMFTFTGCKVKKETAGNHIIRANEPDIQYTGRVNITDTATILYWPGTSVKIRFKGTSLKAELRDAHKKNYYNILLDGKLISMLNPDSVRTVYKLVSGIPDTEHVLELFKRTEWRHGPTYLYNFETGKGTKILKPAKRPDRTIEFFGNSITAGYANEDLTGDSPDSTNTNNYLTYGAITARHYHANYYCTARGGIGVTISWFPMIMDDMYNRLDPEDPESRWNFSKVTPDIVVINLFQNDSWLVNKPDYPEFKHRFGNEKPSKEFIIDKYTDLLKKIRKEYPEANIICTLGTMDATKEGSPWPGYIRSSVKKMNDKKIYTLFFPYQNYDGHPEVRTHKEMADLLIHFIDERGLWD